MSPSTVNRLSNGMCTGASVGPSQQFEMILESSRRPDLRPAVHRLYDQYVAALAQGRSSRGLPTSEGLDRALFAALDGLVLQYLAHAITARQFSDAVDALGTAVASADRVELAP